MINTKQQYCELCEKDSSIPIFMQAWWYNAVSIENKTWNVVGGLPYIDCVKARFRYALPPQFTQIAHLSDIDTFIAEFKNQKFSYFYQQIAGVTTDDIKKLSNNKFIVKERITYRINDLSNIEIIRKKFSENKRRQLKRAEQAEIKLDINLNVDEFFAFHKLCLKKRNLTINYSKQLLQSVHDTATAHNQCQILATRNTQNEITAAVFLVWDKNVCYYLIPTYDIDYTKTGSMAWLTLEAIRFAQSKSKIFDFEGSMIPSIANSYQQFGGKPYKYYSIEKRNNIIFGLLFDIYKWIKK